MFSSDADRIPESEPRVLFESRPGEHISNLEESFSKSIAMSITSNASDRTGTISDARLPDEQISVDSRPAPNDPPPTPATMRELAPLVLPTSLSGRARRAQRRRDGAAILRGFASRALGIVPDAQGVTPEQRSFGLSTPSGRIRPGMRSFRMATDTPIDAPCVTRVVAAERVVVTVQGAWRARLDAQHDAAWRRRGTVRRRAQLLESYRSVLQVHERGRMQLLRLSINDVCPIVGRWHPPTPDTQATAGLSDLQPDLTPVVPAYVSGTPAGAVPDDMIDTSDLATTADEKARFEAVVEALGDAGLLDDVVDAVAAADDPSAVCAVVLLRDDVWTVVKQLLPRPIDAIVARGVLAEREGATDASVRSFSRRPSVSSRHQSFRCPKPRAGADVPSRLPTLPPSPTRSDRPPVPCTPRSGHDLNASGCDAETPPFAPTTPGRSLTIHYDDLRQPRSGSRGRSAERAGGGPGETLRSYVEWASSGAGAVCVAHPTYLTLPRDVLRTMAEEGDMPLRWSEVAEEEAGDVASLGGGSPSPRSPRSAHRDDGLEVPGFNVDPSPPPHALVGPTASPHRQAGASATGAAAAAGDGKIRPTRPLARAMELIFAAASSGKLASATGAENTLRAYAAEVERDAVRRQYGPLLQGRRGKKKGKRRADDGVPPEAEMAIVEGAAEAAESLAGHHVGSVGAVHLIRPRRVRRYGLADDVNLDAFAAVAAIEELTACGLLAAESAAADYCADVNVGDMKVETSKSVHHGSRAKLKRQASVLPERAAATVSSPLADSLPGGAAGARARSHTRRLVGAAGVAAPTADLEPTGAVDRFIGDREMERDKDRPAAPEPAAGGAQGTGARTLTIVSPGAAAGASDNDTARPDPTSPIGVLSKGPKPKGRRATVVVPLHVRRDTSSDDDRPSGETDGRPSSDPAARPPPVEPFEPQLLPSAAGEPTVPEHGSDLEVPEGPTTPASPSAGALGASSGGLAPSPLVPSGNDTGDATPRTKRNLWGIVSSQLRGNSFRAAASGDKGLALRNIVDAARRATAGGSTAVVSDASAPAPRISAGGLTGNVGSPAMAAALALALAEDAVERARIAESADQAAGGAPEHVATPQITVSGEGAPDTHGAAPGSDAADGTTSGTTAVTVSASKSLSPLASAASLHSASSPRSRAAVRAGARGSLLLSPRVAASLGAFSDVPVVSESPKSRNDEDPDAAAEIERMQSFTFGAIARAASAASTMRRGMSIREASSPRAEREASSPRAASPSGLRSRAVSVRRGVAASLAEVMAASSSDSSDSNE